MTTTTPSLVPSLDQAALATRAVHAGVGPDPTTGAILTPIHQSTTYVQEAVGRHKGYTYSRTGNPTVAALERNLGEVERAEQAVCYPTGMAAITGLFLGLLRSGDRLVVSDVVYGGVVRLLRKVLDGFGIEVAWADTSDPEHLREVLAPGARLVLIETPANPTLKLTDIAACAALAREAGALLAVDNTFLTPALQEPLELGADLVVHSTTKYIEGHNSTVGGAVIGRDPEVVERLRFVRNTCGLSQSPLDAWLTLRGNKTLALRLKQHSANALRVAEFLEAHPAIAQVAYPFLPSFPQYDLARRQQRAGGGVVSFTLAGGTPAGIALMNTVRLCSLAENLGAVETLITHPASMTHASLTAAERERLGITDGLVRLSVGLEDPEDVIADLAWALETIGGAR